MQSLSPVPFVQYLQAVADRATAARGFKRPTVAALNETAGLLGLPDRVSHAASGYHVGHGSNFGPCSNLAEAAASLLRRFEASQQPAPAPARRRLTDGQRAIAEASEAMGCWLDGRPFYVAQSEDVARLGFATFNPETECIDPDVLPADCYPPARRPVLPGETLPPAEIGRAHV